jgi:predicted phage terminase large subunit-like protein
LVVRGPWNREFLDEFEAFPQGPHDDIVDATSKACNKLASYRQREGLVGFGPQLQ